LIFQSNTLTLKNILKSSNFNLSLMKKLLRFALVMVAALTMNISFAQTNLTEAVDFTVTDTEGHFG